MIPVLLLWSVVLVSEPSELPVSPPSQSSSILEERLEAVRKSPTDPRARLELGIAYADAEDYDLAMAELVESIYLNRNNKDNLTAQANFQLGRVLAALERPDLATKAYREALGLGLQEARVYSALGEALAAERKYEEAIGEYRAALSLSPNSFAAHAGLALVLEASGKLDEALTEYEAALQSAPPGDDHTLAAITHRLMTLRDRRRL
jgi:tetratricopeptide (TPR) repeat protein